MICDAFFLLDVKNTFFFLFYSLRDVSGKVDVSLLKSANCGECQVCRLLKP
jgi:hypothetical protein